MQTRKLGYTDLEFTEIGFGAWALGGGNWKFGWGEQDDMESIHAILRALELGVNWIDTAAAYGLGHSEEVIAKALEGRREEMYIATKCSLVWDEQGEITPNLRYDSVIEECENSLRRLRTDYIDLYQIHWPRDEERIQEGWKAISKLIEDGKVRYGGVSNFSVSQMRQLQPIHPIASLQPPYSMLRRGVEVDGEFDYCREKNIGVICYSPMQSGLLTGKFDVDRVDDNDWRKQAGEFQEPNLSINLDFVENLRKIANKYDKTVAQLAIAWTLRREEVTAAIAGARRPSQIEETVGGSGWEIEKEDLDNIESLLEDRLRKLKEKGGYISGTGIS